MTPSAKKFISMIGHPVRFRMFLFSKLPAAFFSGIRIREIDEERAAVSVPYKWLTQNPFRSTYFASLAMAAEMSTGVLAMMHVYKRIPPVSMLVTNMQASYFKKATGRILFICEDGKQIHEAIERSVTTGKPGSVTARSAGTNKNGEPVAEFLFAWSFKVKTV